MKDDNAAFLFGHCGSVPPNVNKFESVWLSSSAKMSGLVPALWAIVLHLLYFVMEFHLLWAHFFHLDYRHDSMSVAVRIDMLFADIFEVFVLVSHALCHTGGSFCRPQGHLYSGDDATACLFMFCIVFCRAFHGPCADVLSAICAFEHHF